MEQNCISNNDVMEAAKLIQKYCKQHGKVDMYCKGCIFNNHICVLNDPDHLPETWELNKLGELIEWKSGIKQKKNYQKRMFG